MKSKGNGTPIQCVQNLLQIVRGECPFDRTKGVSSEFYDMPRDEAITGLIEDATWAIETYEPRVNVDDMNIEVIEERNGSYILNASVSESTE